MRESEEKGRALPHTPHERISELRELLATLVYWHDHGHIDESWWEEARRLSVPLPAKPVRATAEAHEAIAIASGSLLDDEHLDDCPIKHGISVDCVWPIAVCVPADFEPTDEEPRR